MVKLLLAMMFLFHWIACVWHLAAVSSPGHDNWIVHYFGLSAGDGGVGGGADDRVGGGADGRVGGALTEVRAVSRVASLSRAGCGGRRLVGVGVGVGAPRRDPRRGRLSPPVGKRDRHSFESDSRRSAAPPPSSLTRGEF